MRPFDPSKIERILRQERAFLPLGDPVSLGEFARDVRQGLSKHDQKELFSKYLYDEVGSALFDVITVLPEYGLTRADARLLRAHSKALAQLLASPCMVVELGSGSGSKTKWILDELAAREPVMYVPIDISESALQKCRRELGQIDGVEVIPIARSYLDGLQEAISLRPKDTSLLLLFLGSTIGNFEPDRAEEFLGEIRQLLDPGDLFYLSTDLEKETPRMIEAYDDAIGVTAAFNLNLLARINRELEGTFVLSRFRHEARYNERERRIEMHLRVLSDQIVAIGRDFRVDLRQGETIWTESSYKFRCADILQLARLSGFECEAQWVDAEWPFAQSVLRAK